MRKLLIAALLATTFHLPALAQDIRQERVQTSASQVTRVIASQIRGYEIVDYRIDASTGQQLAVSMTTSNASAYFNVYGPIGPDGMPDAALFTGSVDGLEYSGTVSSTGDFVIRVYLMRNAARRNEQARYKLTIRATGVSPDFADGLSGGPDFWRVTNVPAGDKLNMRAEPSASARIVAKLDNGAVLKNGGCRMNGATRWCKVTTRDASIEGWVAGRYLRE